MNICRRVSAWLLGACLLVAATPALAGTFVAFGPEIYRRQTESPVVVAREFTVRNPSVPYFVRIHNGGDGRFDRVSSAIVTLNGAEVVGPSAFSQSVAFIERGVALRAANELTVELRSAPESAFVLEVVGIDEDPPTIHASASPAANAHGWNREDVTVTFTCDDATSGIASCPSPVVTTGEGADQRVTGRATDVAGNTASATVTLNIDRTPPSVQASSSPAPNAAGWNHTDVVVTFSAEDPLSGVLSVTPPVHVADEGNGIAITGTAVDRAGNSSQTFAVVSVDRTPPVVAITSPAAGAVFRAPQVQVTGTAVDAHGITALTVNGAPVASEGAFATDLTLTEGSPTITAAAEDPAGNRGSASVSIVVAIPPAVRITSPPDLTAVGTTPVTITGTVDDPEATVVVDETPATVADGTFTATGVPLREGGNVITAVATDRQGNAGTDTVTLVLDTTAPRVFIDSPPTGSVTTNATVAVTGRVNDIVLGTVNSEQARVTVNGIAAEVSHRTFSVAAVPLVPGPNTITATARDAVGNFDTNAITVILDVGPGPRIDVVSGNGQSGEIGATLPLPLVASLTAQAGEPLAGRSVLFRVFENNGALIDADGQHVRALAATTDAQGRASARYALGSRAGVGNNRVEATSPGIAGAAVFTASATSRPPAKLSLDAGNGQKGAVGQPLPSPFVVVATDEGHNRLPEVPVAFRVVQGDGSFNGATEVTVRTDSDGRALVVLTLGPTPGIENNVVEASVSDPAVFPAGFVASGLAPGDPAETRISGVVLDNSNVPIPGVTLRIRGAALSATASAQGQFSIVGVPVGDVHLQVDGSTAQREGTWPDLEYELVTVPGADNTLGMPIFLLPLDTEHGIFVDETHGGTLTLPDMPGFSLTVAPNSATFPDGTRRGTITVTAVHPDKVPMVPNFGQQPRFIVTIQPPGVRFDPPAAVTHPNVDGLAPGEKTELYSFDHDMGSFVATGTATVSEDGTVIRSDPGVGIVKGGWHCGGNPSVGGTTHNCPDCQKCVNNRCEPDLAAGDPPCCKGKKYDTATQCCEAKGVLPKTPISNLDDCPRRVARAGHTPSANGCTGVPENPNQCGPAFTPACNNHDICFDTCRNPKATCDGNFRTDLIALCNTIPPDRTTTVLVGEGMPVEINCRADCLGNASTYAGVVGAMPAFAFYNPAQKNACQCCP